MVRVEYAVGRRIGAGSSLSFGSEGSSSGVAADSWDCDDNSRSVDMRSWERGIWI